MAMPDLVIRAGRVLDGSGTEPVTADIAVRDGLIAEIGRVRDRAHRVIDADGALVIPGLCALFPPSDVALFDRNRQFHRVPGVTTTIEVASETSVADVPGFLRSNDSTAFVVDRLFTVDHERLRAEVMGNKVRDQLDASDGDIATMASLLAAALKSGAAGLRSTVSAGPEELLDLLAGANIEIETETETAAAATVILHGEREPGELLEIARSFRSSLPFLADLAIATSEPLDDDWALSALVPGGDANMADLFESDLTLAGPGINPLGLLQFADPETLTLMTLATRWQATASLFGLADRGVLASDLRADINIIDDVLLAPDLTSGVVSTLVHGTEIVSNDELTGDTPGRLAAKN